MTEENHAKLMKKLLMIVLFTAALLALLCGSLIYFTRCRITDIDAVPSPDGAHVNSVRAVREPDCSHAGLTEDTLSESVTDLSSLVSVNDQNESVFAVSVCDFIECYNDVYRRYYGQDYLTAVISDEWYCCSELSPRFGYEAVRYEFSEDRTVWPMPTVSIYAPDNDAVYEIRMTFDDHGYQDKLYNKYKKLCACLLKMAYPDLSDGEIDNVFCELYSLSDENFFGDHHAYADPERPPLSRLLQSGNIGFYCFYGSGDIEICMIPLTTAAIELLEAEGVDVQSIQEQG